MTQAQRHAGLVANSIQRHNKLGGGECSSISWSHSHDGHFGCRWRNAIVDTCKILSRAAPWYWFFIVSLETDELINAVVLESQTKIEKRSQLESILVCALNESKCEDCAHHRCRSHLDK